MTSAAANPAPHLPASPAVARTTMVDVALRCGVSKAAVSKALSWRPGEYTSLKDETRLRIASVAEEMGYRPSWNARALARGRTHLVGVVYLPPFNAIPRGAYEPIAEELDEALAARGYQAVFTRVGRQSGAWHELIGGGRFDGIVCLCDLPAEALRVVRDQRLPAVFVNVTPGKAAAVNGAAWPQVHEDDRRGTELAVRHLIDLGHRRITYYSGRQVNLHPSATIRREAYLRTMADAGLEADEPFLGPVEAFVRRTLDAPYAATAVVDYEHWTAIRVLQHLWRLGVRVPDDLSVVTFNEVYPVDAVCPPLTTVAAPAVDMAGAVMELLFGLMEGGGGAGETWRSYDPRLIVRESTAPPPTTRAAGRQSLGRGETG